MAKILKGVFATAIMIGFFMIMLVASTIDHQGSIPVSDGQLIITVIIGFLISVIGAAGFKSLEN